MRLYCVQNAFGLRYDGIDAICGSIMDRLANFMSSVMMTSEGYYGATSFASSLLANSCEGLDQRASIVSSFYI